MDITDIRGALPRNGSYMRRPLGAISQIAVHWDAQFRPHEYDSVQRYIQEAQEHINRDWGGGARGDGLMYHYKIDNVGQVFLCRDHEDVLWNVGGNPNWYTLAVNFDCAPGQLPTKEQAEAFEKLMHYLCFEQPAMPATQGDVHGHREYVPTECPGDRIEQMVQEYNANGVVAKDDLTYDWPNITPAPQPEPQPNPAPVVEPPKVDPPKPAPTPQPPVVVEPPKPTDPIPPIEESPSVKREQSASFIAELIKPIVVFIKLVVSFLKF